ncbi:MAG: site-specific DNA-methyltransferase [Phycisphaerae bacterium]
MVYVDPPYFTKRDYEGVRRDIPGNGNGAGKGATPAQGDGSDQANDEKSYLRFSDRWGGDIKKSQNKNVPDGESDAARAAYLGWLEIRIREMYRVLKPGGNFVLHLDWHVVHYAKVLCDGIFGSEQFVNELIWYYQTGGASKSHFSRKNDTLLWFFKGGVGCRVWGGEGGGVGAAASAGGEKKVGYYFDGKAIAIPRTEKAMKRAQCPTGARIKLTDTHKNPDDVLLVPALNPMSNERTGYPTQKPLELLEKLVVALCPPHGLVADFFCGSGTTLVAAQRQGRRYFGCDISADAVKLVLQRLLLKPDVPYNSSGID